MHVYTNSFYNFAGRNGKSTEPAVVTVDCTYPFSLLLIVVFGVFWRPSLLLSVGGAVVVMTFSCCCSLLRSSFWFLIIDRFVHLAVFVLSLIHI